AGICAANIATGTGLDLHMRAADVDGQHHFLRACLGGFGSFGHSVLPKPFHAGSIQPFGGPKPAMASAGPQLPGSYTGGGVGSPSTGPTMRQAISAASWRVNSCSFPFIASPISRS